MVSGGHVLEDFLWKCVPKFCCYKGISTRTKCKKLQVGCKAVAQRKVDQRALCCPMDPITSSSEVSFRSQHIMTSVKNTNVGFVKRNNSMWLNMNQMCMLILLKV